jgi:AcrR family transcriptional regulator
MSKKTKQIRSKKKDRIVDTATDLFTRYGIKRVTIEEICRTAGASKMTFYKYFTNKMDLLKSIWNGWIEEGYRRLDEIDAMEITFREKLQMIIEYKMKMLATMSPAFMDEILHGDPEMKRFVEGEQNESIARFMGYIDLAQERGDMRKIRPEFFLAVLTWMKDVVRNESLRRLYPNDTEFMREVHNFLFFGILPLETRESQ